MSELSVTDNRIPRQTNTHQDHVIAHVLGATVLGSFVFDEALYILLDIGFVWTIFLDGEMGLLPHPVAISELELDAERKVQIKADTDLLLNGSSETPSLMERAGDLGAITDVVFLESDAVRRFVITGESGRVAITMSLARREIDLMNLKDEPEKPVEPSSSTELNTIAQAEHEYLHQRLREDLGREPTEQELEEWLRQHTEGY
jgi:hypothetical protein